MRASCIASALVIACSAPAAPIANVKPSPRIARVAGPTLATAGAQVCRPGDAVSLGPSGAGNAVLAFNAAGGLLAWRPSPDALMLRPLAPDGALRSAVRQVPVEPGVDPHSIHAVGDAFVVLLRKRDLDEVEWWGLVADRDGVSARPVHLGLSGFAVEIEFVVDDRRLALYVVPTPGSSQESHWRLLVRAGDALTSSPTTERPRIPPEPEVAFVVANHAVPPPRQPGGTILEALGDPVLERRRRGQPVGQPLHLAYEGNAIALTTDISDYIVWSGTHFIYPFRRLEANGTFVLRLLPIDCRP